jgi:hypothetical protein
MRRQVIVRTHIASLLAAAVVAAMASAADAAKRSKNYRSQCDAYCQRYPNATPRQLKNARAYDRGGEYWEQDSNAHPIGSPGWWYLKERERGGRGLPF